MGSVRKIKLGINGFGRIGRLVASDNSIRAFGFKSYEEIPLAKVGTQCVVGSTRVFNYSENSNGQLKSNSATRKTIHGRLVMNWRGGQLASFSTIPDNTEDSKSSNNAEMIKNEINEALSSESNSTEFVGGSSEALSSESNSTEFVGGSSEAFSSVSNSAEFIGGSSSSTFDPKDGLKKSAISLFPSIGSNLLYLRDGAGLYNNLFFEDARANYIVQLRKKCFNLMGKSEKLMALVEKCLAQDGLGALTKEMEMLTEIILRSNRVPYGCNSYLNEVKKMRSLASKSTNTKTSVESIKLRSVYQSASMIAQDICSQLRNKTQFRVIFGKIVREIPIEMKNGVEGIHVTISGRINGAEIARTECGKYGKTSRTTISQKVDYACADALTRSGLIGVKVWISYRKNRKGHSSPSVEV